MSPIVSKAVIAGAFFLFIFVSGFLVSRAGKPYPVLLFTVHKLIALGAVVFLGITVHNFYRASGLVPLQIALVAAAGVCFLVTIIAGGLVSIEKPMPAILAVFHRFSPYLTLLSAAAVIYLLFGRVE